MHATILLLPHDVVVYILTWLASRDKWSLCTSCTSLRVVFSKELEVIYDRDWVVFAFGIRAHATFPILGDVGTLTVVPADGWRENLYLSSFKLPLDLQLASVQLLSRCVQSVHFNESGRLTNVGDLMCQGGRYLHAADLSHLASLHVIGKYFMYDCSMLTSLVLPSLHRVTRLEDFFLSGCERLASDQLFAARENRGSGGLSSLPTCLAGIGQGFLQFCSSLTYVNIAHLTNLSNVGSHFLAGCSSLVDARLPEGSFLEGVSRHFMASTSIIHVDLSMLSTVTIIGDGFLSGCQSLTSIDLRPLSSAQEVGEMFLASCSAVIDVDLSALSGVEDFGRCLLRGCATLKSVDLHGLSNLKYINRGAFSLCPRLQRVTITDCPRLKLIGDEFLLVLPNSSSEQGINNTCHLDITGSEQVVFADQIGGAARKEINSSGRGHQAAFRLMGRSVVLIYATAPAEWFRDTGLPFKRKVDAEPVDGGWAWDGFSAYDH